MAKTEDSDLQMVHMRMEPVLLKRVDDFRFKHRFENRSQAIRWLLDWALGQKPQPPAER
jgi:hypothetical protein